MEEKIEDALKAAKGKITTGVTPDDMPKVTQAVLNLMQAKALYLSLPKPTDEMDEEIGIVLGRVRPNLSAVDMMKSTQAALNIIYAKAKTAEIGPKKTKTA